MSRILGTWRLCGVVERFIRSRARLAFGNYSPPTRFNCLCEQGVGGFRGTYRPTCICSQYLVSLGLAWAERGMGALYIKYTWSIGNCATWCNIPAPSSCRSLVAFKSRSKLEFINIFHPSGQWRIKGEGFRGGGHGPIRSARLPAKFLILY